MEEKTSQNATFQEIAEGLYNNILHTSMDGFWRSSKEGRILDANDAYAKMSGYSVAELLELHVHQLEAKERKHDVEEHIGKTIKRGWDRFESIHKRKDGSTFDVEISSTYLEDICEFVVFVKDISEKKAAEEALEENEKKSRAWLEHSPVCTKIVDLDFNLQYMSSSGINQLNIDDINEFYGKPYPFYFYPESFRKIMTKNLNRVKETGEVIAQEASAVDIDGNELWYHSTLVPVKGDNDQPEYIMVVSIETTERKQAEERILESERRFKKLAEMLPETVFESDLAVNLTYVNQQAYKLFGYSHKDFEKGLCGIDLIVPEERERVRENIAKRLQGEDLGPTEYNAIDKDGSVFPVLMRTGLIFEQGAPIGLRGIIVDISDRKKAEEQLAKQHDHLEETVAERTKELQTIVSSMSGREIRMAELKKVIEKLRKQLENAGITPEVDDPLKGPGIAL